MTRYISDLHFGHRNIIQYDNRPFDSVDAMDKAMMELWNESVSDKDTVYILGDMVWQSRINRWESILNALNGKKFIVKGNHDETSTIKELEKRGVIEGWAHQYIVSDNGTKVVLNHSPMPFFVNQHHENYVHLYGHVHVSYDYNMVLSMQRTIEELYKHPIRMYNVGAMLPYINYIPRTLKEIEDGYRQFNADKLKFVQKYGERVG